MKTWYVITAVLALAFSSCAQAAGVPSITARGQKISVGDTADSVFAVLKQADLVNQDVEKTSDGLRVIKRYRVQGKAFVLVFVRGRQGGYVVSRIDARDTADTSAFASKGYGVER
jgi:hypothetical protein